MNSTFQPPEARREPHVVEQLGRTRTDPYAWMRDPNWQAVLRDPAALRPDIRAHLERENAYTADALAGTDALQETILAEMIGRIRADDSSVPVPDGPWAYYTRFAEGAQHPLHARRPSGDEDDAREQVLLDVDALARPHAYFRVAGSEHSPDHRLYAWAEDRQGSEAYTIHVLDLATRAAVGAPIESAAGSFAFSPDGGFLFWTFRDDNGRPTRVLRRPVGGGPADDVPVHEERDPGFFVGVEVTRSRGWIVVECGNQETSEAWVIPAGNPTAPARCIAPRETGVRYSLDDWGDRFVVLTNADGAIDYRIATVPHDAPAGRGAWQEWLAHSPGRYVTALLAFEGFLVHVERVDASDRIVVSARDGASHVIAAEDEASCLAPRGGSEFATATLRYVYDSPRDPAQVFDYDMASRTRTLRKTQEIPSGHDPQDYVVRRLHARASDGASVPVTVLARRDAIAAGPCPLLFYGYGAYGMAMMPHFSANRFSLVDRGWAWAIAHVRGGSEKGRGWFLDGRGAAKTNTFTDFLACADMLVEAGIARPGGIVAHGGSAGGLLMGAVLNLRPELWAGVAAAVPFVDVLNTMSDASLPLTPPEWPEWGNPLLDEDAYDRIAAYSPYDQVGPRPYPPVLALGGLSDPRVTYWEPAKWVARLRAETTGTAPILLRITMEGGHGGRSGRFEYLREPALVQAFALWTQTRECQRLR